MPISRQRKEELVAQYTELLRDSQGIIVTEYRGMNTAQFNALRSKMRDLDSAYMVTKNTLLRRALQEVGMPIPEGLINGPVAVAFARRDLSATAKAVLDFHRDVEVFLVKGAMAGDAVFEGEGDVKALSELPSLDELRAQLLGLIIAPAANLLALVTTPASGLVGVINGGATQLLNVIAAYAAKEAEAA